MRTHIIPLPTAPVATPALRLDCVDISHTVRLIAEIAFDHHKGSLRKEDFPAYPVELTVHCATAHEAALILSAVEKAKAIASGRPKAKATAPGPVPADRRTLIIRASGLKEASVILAWIGRAKREAAKLPAPAIAA